MAIAASVLALAIVLAVGATMLPADKGYSIVGTHVFPLMVAALLGVLGACLLWQSATGRLQPLALDANPEPDDRLGRWQAVGWVSLGLILHALLIDRVGFVLSAVGLFALVARGFGNRRWARHAALGLAIVWPIYWLFTLGLNISLPGLWKPWI